MSELQPGQSLTIDVDPGLLHVPTGIAVRAGEQYSFSATGKWKDWYIVCDHRGWGRGWFTRLPRVPGQPFFRLCGCVGKQDGGAFAIDMTRPWTVPDIRPSEDDTQLYLFANDIRWMYWNNRVLPKEQGGPMRVTVARVR